MRDQLSIFGGYSQMYVNSEYMQNKQKWFFEIRKSITYASKFDVKNHSVLTKISFWYYPDVVFARQLIFSQMCCTKLYAVGKWANSDNNYFPYYTIFNFSLMLMTLRTRITIMKRKVLLLLIKLWFNKIELKKLT